MILSVRHKFIFIKGMKVAGTSMEMALAPLCGPADIVTPISPVDEVERLGRGGGCRNYSPDAALEEDYRRRLSAAGAEQLATLQHPPLVYYNHMPLREVAQEYGASLAGFRIVGVERSPYAKVISWANMRLTYGRYRDGSGEMRADYDLIRAYLDQSFENGRVLDCRNIDRYRDAGGKVAAQLMRYATLTEDFGAFVQSLGMVPPPLPHAKKGLLSDTLDPSVVLRRDQVDRINSSFAEEFDAFGYERI